jgi:hypothetical protein
MITFPLMKNYPTGRFDIQIAWQLLIERVNLLYVANGDVGREILGVWKQRNQVTSPECVYFRHWESGNSRFDPRLIL